MDDLRQLGTRLLVVFDGHCGLCNRSVRWFVRRDRRDRLRFVSSDSEKVAGLLARHGLSASVGVDTILVVCHPGTPAEVVLVRSDAVAAMLAELPGPWSALAALLRLVPRPVRDLGYRLIARWRYRVWGRLDGCPAPTPQQQRWFL